MPLLAPDTPCGVHAYTHRRHAPARTPHLHTFIRNTCHTAHIHMRARARAYIRSPTHIHTHIHAHARKRSFMHAYRCGSGSRWASIRTLETWTILMRVNRRSCVPPPMTGARSDRRVHHHARAYACTHAHAVSAGRLCPRNAAPQVPTLPRLQTILRAHTRTVSRSLDYCCNMEPMPSCEILRCAGALSLPRGRIVGVLRD